MDRRKMLWAALVGVPLAVAGGLAYAKATQPQTYTCPVTGEQLACEKCCPLNGVKAEADEGGQPYVCPVTGEELACPNCCPLNEQK